MFAIAMCCDVDLKWLSFYKDTLISKCIIAYKRLRDEVPLYFNDLLTLNSMFTLDRLGIVMLI